MDKSVARATRVFDMVRRLMAGFEGRGGTGGVWRGLSSLEIGRTGGLGGGRN